VAVSQKKFGNHCIRMCLVYSFNFVQNYLAFFGLSIVSYVEVLQKTTSTYEMMDRVQKKPNTSVQF
jgi:hypothetical protein